MSLSLDSPRDIDGSAGPSATAVTYGELHVDHAVVQEQRLPFASEGESLVRVAGQSTFQRVVDILPTTATSMVTPNP
jgi:hypothetical protein